MAAERNPQVGKAVVTFRELSAEERVRDMYERREKARRDIASQKRWAVKQKQIEIAKNALQMNIALDDIIKFTGLTREEVENIQSEE